MHIESIALTPAAAALLAACANAAARVHAPAYTSRPMAATRATPDVTCAPVARGEAEIGFQQISEPFPIPGVDFVGALPPELRRFTVFSPGIPVHAKRPKAAREVIRSLLTAAGPVLAKSGMEPVNGGAVT